MVGGTGPLCPPPLKYGPEVSVIDNEKNTCSRVANVNHCLLGACPGKCRHGRVLRIFFGGG